MEVNPYEQRYAMAVRLLRLFKTERRVYMATNVAVLLFLIPVGVYSFFASDDNLPVITAFFGSAGAVSYTTRQLLRIWQDVFHAVMGTTPAPDGDGQ